MFMYPEEPEAQLGSLSVFFFPKMTVVRLELPGLFWPCEELLDPEAAAARGPIDEVLDEGNSHPPPAPWPRVGIAVCRRGAGWPLVNTGHRGDSRMTGWTTVATADDS